MCVSVCECVCGSVCCSVCECGVGVSGGGRDGGVRVSSFSFLRCVVSKNKNPTLRMWGIIHKRLLLEGSGEHI